MPDKNIMSRKYLNEKKLLFHNGNRQKSRKLKIEGSSEMKNKTSTNKGKFKVREKDGKKGKLIACMKYYS